MEVHLFMKITTNFFRFSGAILKALLRFSLLPFSPCILNVGFYELSFFPVLFFKNRRLVRKNLEKLMEASLEISIQREYFQKFRVNFVFSRADECIFNVRRNINFLFLFYFLFYFKKIYEQYALFNIK